MAKEVKGILNYACIKCNEPVSLEYRPLIMSERTTELWEKLFDGRVCIKCYTNSDKAISVTADRIMEMLVH